MKGLDNQMYVLILILSNIAALLQFILVLKWPRIGRISFFILFAWASWTNWNTLTDNPMLYLAYADLTWSEVYKQFITGWFVGHIHLVVGIIATAQALIAVSMILKGSIFKLGAIGAILFFVSILPLGLGSGFPCTAIMAVSMFFLLRKHENTYAWEHLNKLSHV